VAQEDEETRVFSKAFGGEVGLADSAHLLFVSVSFRSKKNVLIAHPD